MKLIAPVVFLVCLCIVPQQIIATNGKRNVIQKTCQHTSYKDLCISSLQSDPTSNQSDLNGLALVALKVASTNASDIAEHIKVLFNDTKLSGPDTQQGLYDCLDHYLDAAEQLDDSIAALLANAYEDVKTWVQVAADDAQSCEASFLEKPSVLTQKNLVFSQLCQNAIAISSLLA